MAYLKLPGASTLDSVQELGSSKDGLEQEDDDGDESYSASFASERKRSSQGRARKEKTRNM